MTTGIPYIHLKVAVSIDGKLGGRKKRITSGSSREQVHRWRATHDAILVGAGTVIEDDPRLDVRHVRGRDPHVVILDGRLRVPPRARVFSRVPDRRVLLCTSAKAARENPEKVRKLRAQGTEVLVFGARDGRIPLREVCKNLLRNNIGSILVEGGEDISGGFFSAGLVDELSIFVAPIILGGNVNVFRVQAGVPMQQDGRTPRHTSTRRVEPDVMLSYLYN